MAPSSAEGLEYDGRYFEALFSREDPWNYGSEYEQVKYRQTLSLLGHRRFESALEIGCAEGRFTELLVPHVDRLLAVDVSPTALARAGARLRGSPRVRFARHDVFREDLPERYDLIVCSEVLAYLPRRKALEEVFARLLRALEPDGLLVMANARAVADEPEGRGFDWRLPFGARTLAEVATAMGASLHEELAAPLYAIHSFCRRERPAEPRRRWVDMGAIPEEVAVAARGMPRRSAQPPGTSIPVLAYHRIAKSGPAALAPYRVAPSAFADQMAFLADNGVAVLSLAQFRDAHVLGLPVPHRSVLLTFDDAYRDFAERALPALERHGFPAALFVVENRVGGHADWDAAYGEPAALLDWAELRDVARRNVAIGSHTRTHPHLAALPAEDAVAELATSRARLEAELGRPVAALAYPYGEASPLVATWAACCGYELAFTCREDRSALADDRMLLPRITVYGQDGLEDLAAKLIGISKTEESAPAERSRASERVATPGARTTTESASIAASIAASVTSVREEGAPEISVVIPTRNRCPLVESLLQSLAASDLPRERFEILVVSDGSTDETDRRLAEHWGGRITLLRQEPSGAAAARNHGIRHARGELILLVDDDMVVERDLLEAHLRFHREWPEDHHACLGFMAWPADLADEPLARYLTESDEYLHWRWVRQRPADDVGWRGFWTGHLSLKRRFLEAHGTFDAERFLRVLGEDLELGRRLEGAGLKLHFRDAADSIVVWHQKVPSFSEFAWRHFHRGRANARNEMLEAAGISPSDAAGLASEEGLEPILRAVEGAKPEAEPHLLAALYREALRFADAAGRASAGRSSSDAVDRPRPPLTSSAPSAASSGSSIVALLQSLATLRAYTSRELGAKTEELQNLYSAYDALERRCRQLEEGLASAQAALGEGERRARNRERENAELTRLLRISSERPAGPPDGTRKSLRFPWGGRSEPP